MKRLLLLLTLAIAPAFCQTPCIEAAKTGVVGSCLDRTVRVTPGDAQFVPVTPVKGYTVDPTVPYSIALEFSTKEQAQALVELIKFVAPGSKLTINDLGSQFTFAPFRQLQYFNAGGLFDPRVYYITGTVRLADVDYQVSFEPGWFVNVTRLIYRGSNSAGDFGFPQGADRVAVVVQFGGAQPLWVGK